MVKSWRTVTSKSAMTGTSRTSNPAEPSCSARALNASSASAPARSR
jgi:hypothetical protein